MHNAHTVEPWDYGHCIERPTGQLRPPPAVPHFLPLNNTQCFLVNPLRPIGSPVTHENWPTNWPEFAASPTLFGWPACNCNRHTVACMHQFSYILRWSPVPVVWFMSESRAVATSKRGYKWTLPSIPSSFWMTVGLKGLMRPLCNAYSGQVFANHAYKCMQLTSVYSGQTYLFELTEHHISNGHCCLYGAAKRQSKVKMYIICTYVVHSKI